MIFNHEVVRSLSPSITTPSQHVSCDLADAASSPGYLARLAQGPAGSAPPSLCPSGRRFVLVAAVVLVVLADLVADPAVVAVVGLVSGPGSVGFVAAVVAVVVATSAST